MDARTHLAYTDLSWLRCAIGRAVPIASFE
jgi:hypothetical protein